MKVNAFNETFTFYYDLFFKAKKEQYDGSLLNTE